jgi:excisionase family DNA binding protein
VISSIAWRSVRGLVCNISMGGRRPHTADVRKPLLSMPEAAKFSGLSASHLRLLARTGRLEATKLGRDWFTTETAVRAYLSNDAARSRNPHKGRRS